MKTREGFVSNSSSSSFILAMPRRPDSVEELRFLLFGKHDEFTHPYDEVTYPAQQVAEAVFQQLMTQGNLLDDVGVMTEVISGGSYDGMRISAKKFTLPNGDTDWNAYEEAISQKAREIAKKFMAKNENMKFFVVTFGDKNGPFEAALEHGDTFKAIPHLTISHH